MIPQRIKSARRSLSTINGRILNDFNDFSPVKRPTPVKQKTPQELRKYAFYDLVLRTPTHPREPMEASLMSKSDFKKLLKSTSTSFVGNYSIDETLTPEQRIEKIFGGRIKGDAPRSSSRINRGEAKVIAGITVPDKPKEPDNCCMSGCINCVWELFNEDVKDWNDKRKSAAQHLAEKGGKWPSNFYAPIQYLKEENYPEDFDGQPADVKALDKSEDEESWGNVPVTIRVFAEMEKKLKAKKLQKQQNFR